MNLSNETILHTKKNGIEYIQFRKLLEYPEVVHAYTLRTNLDFKTREDGANLQESYQKLGSSLHFSVEDVIRPAQSHTDKVEIVETKKLEKEHIRYLKQFSDVDGLITNEKNVILSTTSADCIAFLFFDPVQKVIANIHSGWKGTLKQIARKTIEKMQEEKHCNPKDILVFSCPSILQCHFEVDKDVADAFVETFPFIKGKEEYIKAMGEKQGKPKWNIDTVAINRVVLENAGIPKENIVESNICTVCHKQEFHSYRADGKANGLNTAIIGLK